ncbi:sugar-phosphate isomerase RpiB/LacA/LacB family [Clostridium sp. CAG:914]|jgi:ribose 5-phosphate isomerase B|nr:sugar-phosphate isomerase RpiB/LacA/LacB family [Clostridium sp. CAG:914]
MKIGITNDHRGVKKKQLLTNFLTDLGYTINNYGTDTEDSVDFPDYAYKLGRAIQNNEVDLGIAICGTGIGMSIVLNKMKGVYCAKVANVSEAILSKSHNDANVIAISEEMDDFTTKEVIVKFIETPFSNVDRYVLRNEKIKDIEDA